MALEALASGVTRTPLVIGLLDKWKKDVEELIQTVDSHSDDAASLEAVSRELIFRKEDSIRRQIRNVVLSTLADHGDQDAEQAAKIAVKIYDLRSKLVHDGILESQVLSTAISDAKALVERVLRARFTQEAK
jgi:formylmethanofuran dehydrogenase subunit A